MNYNSLVSSVNHLIHSYISRFTTYLITFKLSLIEKGTTILGLNNSQRVTVKILGQITSEISELWRVQLFLCLAHRASRPNREHMHQLRKHCDSY